MQATGKRLAMARGTFDRETPWEERFLRSKIIYRRSKRFGKLEIADNWRARNSPPQRVDLQWGRLTSYEIRSPLDGAHHHQKSPVGGSRPGTTPRSYGRRFVPQCGLIPNIYKDITTIKTGQKATVKSTGVLRQVQLARSRTLGR